ncbi:hypothetical protein N1F89_06325, partial [Aquibium sp. A9E412]|nr:hypothetical protein [Aquibium sp. A9E412]
MPAAHGRPAQPSSRSLLEAAPAPPEDAVARHRLARARRRAASDPHADAPGGDIPAGEPAAEAPARKPLGARLRGGFERV